MSTIEQIENTKLLCLHGVSKSTLHFDCMFLLKYLAHCGPGSSISIATDYRLDGLGSNPGGDEIFRLSGPALGPTHPPVKWVPGLCRG